MAEGQATTIKRVYLGQLLLRNAVVVFIGDFFYFFVWWYSTGLVQFLQYIRSSFRFALQLFPVAILLRNLFKPMFGDYTWQGHLIGFFLRSVQLVVILLALILWSLVSVGVVALWLVVLPLTVWSLAYLLHLTALSPATIL